MQNIAHFFVQNSKLTIVLSIGMVVFGLMGLVRMNAESFPSVSMATATIVTSYDGASAEDIEIKITKPIEDEIRGVTGLKDIRSTSQSGLSTIVVRVDMDDPKVDVIKTMDEIQKAVDRTTGLPNDLNEKPKFTEIKSEEFPVYELAIIGDNQNRKRDIIADHLKEEIEDLKSIKNARLVGDTERAFRINLSREKMSALHISLDEVLAQVGARNKNTPGGALRTKTDQQLVRIEGKVSNTTELGKVVIRSNFSGQTVLLEDIATIEDGHADMMVRTRHDGQEATLVVITKKGGADTISMVQNITKKIDRFKKSHPEYQFKVYNDEGVKVANRVDVLKNNAISGLLLVIVFLFIFLPGKVGIAASFSLPLAIMGTLGIMPYFGMNIDTITVLALVIALGMLVDNSVVISENFTRLRREGLSSSDAAKSSVRSLWLPISATAFTTIAAFLPMLVTKGVMGEFIKWIPIVVTISLILSLIESFFFLPMRLVAAGSNISDGHKKKMDWFSLFEIKFENLMAKVVRGRYIVAFFFFIIVAASIFFMVIANKFILFPADQTEIYIARVELPRGSRLEQTDRILSEISHSVQDILKNDVTHIVARSGTASMGPADPKAQDGNNVGMLSIYVNEHAKLNRPSNEVLALLREIKIENIGISFEAMVNGPPVGNAIEATFRSNNATELDAMIEQVKKELGDQKGIFNLKVNEIIGDDEVYVKLDYAKAARLGLDAHNIGQTLRTAISGKRHATVTLNNKDVDLIVRFQEDQRMNTADLAAVKLRDPRGNLIPLSSVAEFETLPGSPQIKRFDFKRAKTLTGDVNEELITSVQANQKLTTIYQQALANHPGVSLVFGGAAESTKESMESLFQALVLSLIGIFALLVFLFKSYLRPLIIMTTIPLGLLGFSIAFYLHQRPVSFLALIGIIGLGGIIVNSGIVLISFIDQMREEGELSLEEILAKASGMRLRAVLVTSLTTISGLIPTAYGIGGSDAILIPMTLAMAWGLTSGTILTLIWVPAAYAILEDFGRLKQKMLSFRTKDVDSESNNLAKA